MLPHSSTIDWQTAIKGVLLGSLRPLHFYETWRIRSMHLTVYVPSVVLSSAPSIGSKKKVAHSPTNVLLRDSFTCQYCGAKNVDLTMDHVKPRSQGGSSRLDNLSAACKTCNNKKGDNAAIVPKIMPYVPSYFELFKKRKLHPIRVPHESWIEFINWDRDLVEVVEPYGMPGYIPREVEEQLTSENTVCL